MDLLQYTNKSKTIDERIKSIMNAITADYNNGIIRTETEYYYRLKAALESFYKTLNSPMFVLRKAKDLPISSEYNSMISEANSDMSYLVNDCKAMGELISQSYIEAELGRTMIQNEVNHLNKLLSQLQQSILNSNGDFIVFTELFETTNNAGNIGAENACVVNTSEGILTLGYSSTGKANITNISIDENASNGFPGNTHVVDTLNGEMHFSGEDNLHFDLLDVIDEKTDSWYEFEMFHIADEIRKNCNSFGFEYEEGVEWVRNDDDILRLTLEIKLDQTVTCSWFSLNPYLPEIKGILPCYIEKMELITASNTSIILTENKALNGNLVFPFEPCKINKVIVSLIQPTNYPVSIGHVYYSAADTKTLNVFDDNNSARLNGDMPSINTLGVKYDPTTQWIKYPDTSTELPDSSFVKQKLFSIPQATVDKNVGQEILEAYRYLIGIKTIKMNYYVFNPSSEFVSKAYTTKDIIKSVVLEAKEYIPGDDPEILKYYISVDGGINWHKIYPTTRAYNGVYRYTVNNESLENALMSDSTNKHTRNITTIHDVYSVKLKITMDQPDIENKMYASPIVYSYKLILNTGGESLDC